MLQFYILRCNIKVNPIPRSENIKMKLFFFINTNFYTICMSSLIDCSKLENLYLRLIFLFVYSYVYFVRKHYRYNVTV